MTVATWRRWMIRMLSSTGCSFTFWEDCESSLQACCQESRPSPRIAQLEERSAVTDIATERSLVRSRFRGFNFLPFSSFLTL
ncbi:NADH-ubiquinone oxidoreductase subunit [Fusarium oxysporum f. sp. albedinis]|nr:NADH-ubiquinone oxidoreductase subunit [Fusarium oxysporum f. sp. albedinis]